MPSSGRGQSGLTAGGATILRAVNPSAPICNPVIAAIEARRSIVRLTSDRPARADVEAILRAAVHAPNHHHTHPWRFAVLAGDARRTAGEALATSFDRRTGTAGTTADQASRANESVKFLRAPVVICVAVEPAPGEPLDEEVSAGAAAVQNMLLAAHSLGLGAAWRTGATVRDPDAARDFGFAPGAVLIGFVYLGVPDPTQLPKPRPPRPALADVVRWNGWDD